MSTSHATDASGVDAILADGLRRRGASTGAAEAIREQALGWVQAWYCDPLHGLTEDEDLPADLRERVWFNAAYYGIWHAIGASTDPSPGFVALHAHAMRQARGNIERATEAASETYLDVRSRLENTVPRASQGKSIPDFRHPGERGEDNVRHYHLIQTRLRLAGKWETRRYHTELHDHIHDIDWRREFAAAETRTYSVALHFAAWWYVADVRSKTTRSGRTKDVGWWWKMLMHGLDRVKLGSLGGDRNDPTEALHRLRLRFRVCQGLSGWLKTWAQGQPYWSQVDFDLPDLDHAGARASVFEALEQIRPALEVAIEEANLPAREARALVGTLLKGENVRTSTRHFAGDDPASRWERFTELGEQIGRDAARRLRDGGGDGGGGGSGHHTHGDRLAMMARLREGEVPSAATLATLGNAVESCVLCAEAWGATCEADRYLGAVSTQGAEPVVERPRVPRAAWVGAAALALLAPLVMWTPSEQVRLRGAEGSEVVHLDLFVVQESGSAAERFDVTRTYQRGDRVYFSVAAEGSEDVDITVWVTGPEGQGLVGVEVASQEPVRLGEGDDLVFYELERTGTYVFSASALGMGQCPASGCTQRRVEVAP